MKKDVKQGLRRRVYIVIRRRSSVYRAATSEAGLLESPLEFWRTTGSRTASGEKALPSLRGVSGLLYSCQVWQRSRQRQHDRRAGAG